jgi:hypothetical protein
MQLHQQVVSLAHAAQHEARHALVRHKRAQLAVRLQQLSQRRQQRRVPGWEQQLAAQARERGVCERRAAQLARERAQQRRIGLQGVA